MGIIVGLSPARCKTIPYVCEYYLAVSGKCYFLNEYAIEYIVYINNHVYSGVIIQKDRMRRM